ncbi:MAG: porin family protein [Proteobacteria bacterium]|nr:porin family protein [Pseudomonadota bacterium]
MGLVRRSAIGLACVAAGLTGAQAADMPGNRPAVLPPPASVRPLPPAPLLTGWYLRGDIGYRWGHLSGSDPAPGFPAPGSEKLGGSFGGGVGLGVKTGWLRTDGTIDFGSPMKYEATTVAPNDTTAKVSAITALFNGYLDLGSWYNATPYIGAGVGAARLRVSDYQSTVAPPFSGDGAHSQWNFAWAAMAGVAYRIAPNMQLDVGYRYLALGDVSTASDAVGQMTLKNIVNHEVRVGLRWNFNDLPTVR